MLNSLSTAIEELLKAPLRILEWQILLKHPELWSDEGLVLLKAECDRAREKKDFKRIAGLSTRLLLLERCSEVGPEAAVFGKVLEKKQRAEMNVEIPSEAIEKLRRSTELQEKGEWEEAREVVEQLLQNRDLRKLRIFKAETRRILGNILWSIHRGDRAENIELAIANYEKALEVFTRDAFPEYWAMTRNNLATAYWERIRGDRAENIENAITHFEQALEVYTRIAFAGYWAMTRSNMATAYANRIRGDRAENIEHAIENYEQAAEVYTRAAFPENWAKIQNNVAIAYRKRIRGDRAENIERAIAHFEQVLEVWTRDAFPEYWATTQNNVAHAYGNRIHGSSAENIERAIAHSEQALEVITRTAFPKYWAMTRTNLALLYYERIHGSSAENIERAIECYEKILEVYTRNAYPEQWAGVQSNIASAYRRRIRGSRAENIERAITHSRQALEIWTRAAFPEYWALAQDNLALAYWKRTQGSRTENIERAITCFKRALEARTPQTFPREYRRTAMHLAEVLLEEGRWRAALNSCRRAREADRVLQRQATSLSGKAHEVEEGAALYYLASLASAGSENVIDAVKWLEQGKACELGEGITKHRAEFEGKEYVRILERLRVLEAEQRGAVPGARPFTEVMEEAREVHAELERLVKTIQIYKPGFLEESVLSREKLSAFLVDDRTAYIVVNVTKYGSVLILLSKHKGLFSAESFILEKFTLEAMEKLAGRWSKKLEELKHDAAPTVEGLTSMWDGIDGIGRTLYRELFAPAHEWLKANGEAVERLVFVPHLSLHILPLHLMRYNTLDGPRYLIDDYEISYIPSLTVGLKQQGTGTEPADASRHTPEAVSQPAEAPAVSGLLLVSNPTEDLQWSDDEAKRISAIPTAGDKRILSRSSATAERLLDTSAGAGVLHLSCHGEFDPEEPWNSGLVLAMEKNPPDGPPDGSGDRAGKTARGREAEYPPDGAPDGAGDRAGEAAGGREAGRVLTLKEIVASMNLHETGLVVLSSCETGLVGTGGKSDEFVGLPGGFLRAGVRSVVASLWIVDDQATSELMERFYRHLFTDELSSADALRRAQLEIKRNHRWKNPFYWGAFRALGI